MKKYVVITVLILIATAVGLFLRHHRDQPSPVMTEDEIQHLLTDPPIFIIFGGDGVIGVDIAETVSRNEILRQLSISTGIDMDADSAVRFSELRTADRLTEIINNGSRDDQPEMRVNSKDKTIYLYYKKGW